MKKTLVAVPCFDMVHAEFMESVVNLQRPEGTYFTTVRNTMIYIARNIIAGGAYENGFERIMWLDSDMKIPPDAIVKLSADMDKGLNYVSGLYFTRKLPTIKPVVYSSLSWENKDGNVISSAENYWNYPEGLFECAATGFGCCMTSVDLIRRVGERFGAPFTPIEGMGEDLSFCYRVIQLGEKMYCDSSVKCGHVGMMEYNEEYYKQQGGKPNDEQRKG